MLSDHNNQPKRLFGKVEWPIALLFATIPVLVVIALLKSNGVV